MSSEHPAGGDDGGRSAEVTERVESGARAGAAAGRRALDRVLETTTASERAAAILALAVAVAAGSALVGPRLGVVAALSGVACVVAAVPLASRRPVVRAVGGVLAVPAATLVGIPATVALAFGVGLAGSGLFAAVALWALVYAGFGAAAVAWPAAGNGGVRRAAVGSVLVGVGVAGIVALRILPDPAVREQGWVAARAMLSALYGVLVAPTGSWATLTFLALAVVTAVVVGRALAAFPPERVLPPDRRGALSATGGSLRTLLRAGAWLAALAALATLLVPSALAGGFASPTRLQAYLPPGVAAAIVALVRAPALRALLLATIVLGLAALAIARLRSAFRRGPAVSLAGALAPVAGGAAVTLALARALADPGTVARLREAGSDLFPAWIVDVLLAMAPFALVSFALGVALVTLVATLALASGLRAARVLPPRAIGAALAAGSVFALAAALIVVSRLEAAVLTATAAFVVWDAGEYGSELRTELGAGAATLRAELVHGGATLLGAGAVAGAAIALHRYAVVEATLGGPRFAAVAVGIGVGAVVLVAVALRG
ncbi:hypothetical protein [Saliphagus sp. LR7]|uniref:hypothetical protein n=1 Tax=Saliphagus sp. LR7 TaxID=2282654 RepID=UPI000DF77A02|nr:hypothetical protein [Saliphagus sp. LR7]